MNANQIVDERIKAKKRLAAKAPEMREALQFCVGYLEDEFNGDVNGYPDWLKKYRKLLDRVQPT
jgi:hypothetical protein